MSYWYRTELDAESPRPLMLFLHGYGETGGDPTAQTAKHGPWVRSNPGVAADLREWFRIAPHMGQQGGVWNSDDLTALSRDVFQRHADVVPNAVAVVGISRGGWGALDFVSALPNTISVIGTVVFCPERIDAIQAALGRAPVLLFHCEADSVVRLTETRRDQYDVSRQHANFAWVNVHPTWTQGAKHHNCWTRILGESGVYEWLMALRADGAYALDKDRWPSFAHFEREAPA